MAYVLAKQSREQRAIDAVHTMSDFVNDMCRDEEQFLVSMAREHRTLQQSFTGLCFAWIRHCAKMDFRSIDGRNEWSVNKCKEIMEKMEELPEPPLV